MQHKSGENMRPTARFCFILFFVIAQTFATAQQYAKVNINNVSTFVWNDGRMDIAPENGSGFEYWKGTKRYSVYASGVYWGGYINNELRVGGTYYKTSLSAGSGISDGHIFKIRPDYLTAVLGGEINDEVKTEAEIRNQYESDYKKWPGRLGAPFVDIDNNGFYSEMDKPGLNNADQTLWFVCNDLDSSSKNQTLNEFYSKPTNVELQITVWAYSKDDLLKGTIFKRYRLINKDPSLTIKDMYLGIFSDPDIGDVFDDFIGCDTTLNLAFCYNGKSYDSVFGNNVNSYGLLLLQSPVVNSTNESFALINGKKKYGKENIGMSSFHSFPNNQEDWEPSIFERSINYRHLLLGQSIYSGNMLYDPIKKQYTNYPLSGDPVNKTGFTDGILEPAGDRRFQINSGPFNMAPGDTQEVIFAQIVTSGTSRLGLVSYLKYLAKYVKDFYENEMFKNATTENEPTEIPAQYSLRQNYPNPFNPSTSIEYTIPQAEHVTLKVFDVLGREVATLVDEYKQAGNYKAIFNVETLRATSLPSGVYFYKLQAGSYHETKKLILMK